MKKSIRPGIVSMFVIAVLWISSGARAVSGQVDTLKDSIPATVDTLHVTGAGPFLIRPFMVKGTVFISVDGRNIRSDQFKLEHRPGLITFKGAAPDSEFVFRAEYSYVPLSVSASYSRWTQISMEQGNAQRRASSRFSAGSRLSSSGSISRGVMAGTGRDASIESGLRLEVEGQVTEHVRVRASLTDENTPLLPEGTTRRLDQFDQVFIEFSSDAGMVSLGDVESHLREGRFASVDRSVQGVRVSTTDLVFKSQFLKSARFQAVGATSKGQFRSQTLRIEEGVQGPYRLEGNSAERFILVLPGSERVYIDGALLERGFSDDYVIDYTTGEVTFMPSMIMGRDKRVRVEFEYTTNQFTRSFLLGDARVGFGRANGREIVALGFTAIRESDGDSFSQEIGFSTEDSLLVSLSGDALAFSSGAVEVMYDAEALFTQYILTSTGSYEAVTRVPLDGEKVFRVTFSRIGDGLGSYRRTGGAGGATAVASTNGIVYEFAGSGLGDYEPVKPLTAPRSNELIDLRLDLNAIPGVNIKAEWAASRFDKNKLSARDSFDDNGHALSLNVKTASYSLRDVKINAGFDISFRSAHFSTFDRARDIEYERDWNLLPGSMDPSSNIIIGEDENDQSYTISLAHGDSTKLQFSYDRLNLGNIVSAKRQHLEASISEKGIPFISVDASRVSSKDNRLESESEWMRQLSRISRRSDTALIRPFFEWETESLRGTRFGKHPVGQAPNFNELRSGVEVDMGAHSFKIMLEQRFEDQFESASKGLSGSNDTRTFQGSWAYRPSSSLNSFVSLGIRKTDLNSDSDQSEGPAARDALLIGLNGEWLFRSRNRLSWIYQVQSERSATLQEIYIRTGQERGQFVWIDLNGDNVVQLDEFIPETTPGEGEYARTFFPSDSLESVTTLTSSLRLNRRGGGTGSALSRIGIRTVLEVSEKSRDPHRSNIYLMRLGSFRQRGNTISGRIRVVQNIQIFPSNSAFDLGLTAMEVRSFSDLSSGQHSIRQNVLTLNTTYRPTKRWTVSASLEKELDQSNAAFATRTYEISSFSVSPELSLRLKRVLLLSLGADYASRSEKLFNTDVTALRIPFSVRYSADSRLSARASLERASMIVQGKASGMQIFQLTEGRGPGQSWMWQFSLNAKLTDVLRATFSYDGRSPSVGKSIHTGRIQFTARF